MTDDGVENTPPHHAGPPDQARQTRSEPALGGIQAPEPLSPERIDVFGVSGRERLLRRLAGAGAATLAGLALFGWWASPVLLLIVLVVYLVGIPLSWLLEILWPAGRGRSAAGRYALAGAVTGAAVIGGPGVALGEPYLGLLLMFAVPSGALLGAVAAWVGCSLPDRWVWPLATLGAGLVAALTVWWWTSRPPFPFLS